MKDLIRDYEREAQAAWLLATLLRHPPTVEQLHSIRAAGSDGGIEGFSRSIEREDDLESSTLRLRIEHLRLFGGLREGYGPKPPYESLWREGQMLADCTVALSELFYRAGYSRQASGVPADHLCEEFYFKAALLNGEADMRSKGDLSGAEALARIRRQLDTEHLLQWVPQYAKELALQTPEPFFKALAEALLVGVGSDTLGHNQVAGEANAM